MMRRVDAPTWTRSGRGRGPRGGEPRPACSARFVRETFIEFEEAFLGETFAKEAFLGEGT